MGHKCLKKKRPHWDKGGKMASIEERVEKLIQKPIEELGYSLYDVQYAKEGQNYFLRVFIEKINGIIDLNDCEKVNNEINNILDTADYIKEQYFLEVSSTGIEKLLRKDKHLQDNIGNEVEVKLFKPIDKQKEFLGILESFNENEVTLMLENDMKITIARKDISLIKTVFNWEEEI